MNMTKDDGWFVVFLGEWMEPLVVKRTYSGIDNFLFCLHSSVLFSQSLGCLDAASGVGYACFL